MKRVTLILLLSALALFSLSTVQAAQVTWGAYTDNGIGSASGNPLPNGSNDLILLGHFNLTDAQITANGGNEAFLMANFVQFALSTIGATNPNGPGSASDGYWLANSVNSSNTLSIQNTQMYYWAFNAPTAVAATQYGIFTDPGVWKFPDDTAIPPSIITDLDQVPHNSTGILWGSFGLGTSRDGVSPLFDLALIPEPSSIGLVLLGAGLIPLLRRRKA